MQYEKEIQAIKMGRLLLKGIEGELNESEQRTVDQWLESSEQNKKVYQDMINAENRKNEFNKLSQFNAATALERVKGKHGSKSLVTPVWKIVTKWLAATAAVLCIAFGTGLYWYSNNQARQDNPVTRFGGDADPGNNRATLTFGDGSTVNLNGEQKGIIIGNKGIKYANGTSISTNNSSVEAEKLLTLSTPKGGQYQVTLPDGTKVWLNAASVFKYPRQFTDKQRHVELIGEAYFEVAHNKKQPFTVSSKGQQVVVLGTHFNISAYPDENNVKTTLIEGSVSVSTTSFGTNSDPAILIPNQQSILTNGKLITVTVNPDATIAWKDNLFIFHNTNLKTIMRQISRWYDIEVDIPSMPDIEFYAEIPRNVKLSQVLNMLEATSKVKFKIVTKKGNTNERRIIIEK